MTATISKRNFLKFAMGSGLALGSCASAVARVATDDMKWDKTTEVLVLGFGGAGAAAAIEAKKKGADVLILEKMPQPGGNTAVSAGGFMCPDDEAKAYEYLKGTYTYSHAEMDEALLRTFCREVMDLKNFVTGLGENIKLFVYGYAGFKNLPGQEVIKRYRVRGQKGGPKKGAGDCLFDVLKGAVEKAGIEYMTETPVVEMIRKGDMVVGVVAKHKGKEITIRARRAVVLATGGFEFDQESLMNFTMGTGIGALGNPGNTGDGLRLAQSMGAKLWHMNAYSAGLDVRYPGYSTNVGASIKGAGYIWVDQDGRRFANELTDGHCQMYVASQIDAVNHRYPRIPCYLVFDHATLRMGPLGSSLGSGWAINREHHTWSEDCEKEIEMGLVKKANTIADLARAIKVPAEELEATIKRWNEDIRAGKDTLFGRPVKKAAKSYAFDAPLVSAPLEKGPYYALELWPTLVNTQGGPRRDEKARIVSALGKTIPRLYGAGELGSMWGPIYQGACNNAEALVFGRIAGRNAADEKPWC